MVELVAMVGLVFLLSIALAATVYVKRGPRPFLVATAIVAGMVAVLVARHRRRIPATDPVDGTPGRSGGAGGGVTGA